MSAKPVPDHILSEDEPCISPIDRSRIDKYGTLEYKSKYAVACFKLLSSSNMAKTKSHCCAILQCSRPTLHKWMKKYPEFNDAIVDGLELGKAKWRNKIAQHAYKSSKDVNNGLIKLLSANVYGIKDDSEAPNITVNSNNEIDPEKLMKLRGIPIPNIDNEDIDD